MNLHPQSECSLHITAETINKATKGMIVDLARFSPCHSRGVQTVALPFGKMDAQTEMTRASNSRRIHGLIGAIRELLILPLREFNLPAEAKSTCAVRSNTDEAPSHASAALFPQLI